MDDAVARFLRFGRTANRAKNILMSLWQVPDYQTKELMIQFYKNWLEEKMEIHEALKVAQDGMREQGYEPFHWAGFILLE